MPGILYRRGSTWWAALSIGGKRRRVSTRCKDRRAAEAVFARLERELAGAPCLPSDAPAYSLSDALDSLVSHASAQLAAGTAVMYRQKAGHLLRLLGQVDVAALDLSDGKRYVATRLNEGAARETVRKELTTLRQALRLARDDGHYHGNVPIPAFRVRYTPRRRWLTLDEYKAVMRALPPHRQAWMMCACFLGGRDSEIDGLRWEDVRWETATVLVRGTKTEGSEREVPIPAPLLQVLQADHAAILADLRKVNRGATKVIGPIVGEWGNARRDLAAACQRAGVERVSPNDLRRTFASWLKQAGVDSFTVAQLLGHSSSRMVELVYGRLDSAALRRAVSSLPGSRDCVGFVPREGLSVAPVAHPVTSDPPDSSGLTVLGEGIEPSTRGFSVREPRRPEAREPHGVARFRRVR